MLKIIENRVYTGTMVGGKYAVTAIGGKQYVKNPEENRIYVSHTHKAIVTEEEFCKAAGCIKNRGSLAHKEQQHMVRN